jgi:flagellar assembly protein FliH
MTESATKPKSRVIPGSGETAYQRWELPHLLTANQMERIQKQAYDEGFARGQADGLKAAQQDTALRLQSLTAILATLATPLKELDERVEQELVALALAAARLVVRRELKADPGQVMAAVREALAALPAAARHVRLHLHPEDAQLVREHLKLGDEEQAWKIVDDPVLARGGCKVLTDSSQIDATLESRLTAIMAAILGGERSHDRPS